MTRRLLVMSASLLLAAGPARASNWLGVDGGTLRTMGSSTDFAHDGTMLEVYWQHFNKGRSALQFGIGSVEIGFDGAVQETIENYKGVVQNKNLLAQRQGGPGNGWLSAEYGVFRTTYLTVNLLAQPYRAGRFATFVTGGVGLYRWRSPFRLKFYDTPFFGEQRAYEAPAEGGFYSGVLRQDQIDYTKDGTTGGLNGGAGGAFRIASHVVASAQVRAHLTFSSGTGNREEGVDDQDYLSRVSFGLLRGGLSYRF